MFPFTMNDSFEQPASGKARDVEQKVIKRISQEISSWRIACQVEQARNLILFQAPDTLVRAGMGPFSLVDSGQIVVEVQNGLLKVDYSLSFRRTILTTLATIPLVILSSWIYWLRSGVVEVWSILLCLLPVMMIGIPVMNWFAVQQFRKFLQSAVRSSFY
jgi:hypothetical protein